MILLIFCNVKTCLLYTSFDGKGYGAFKTAVGEAVVEELRPIRERYEKLVADKASLESCYRKADEIALKISSRTMGKVMKLSLIHI